MMEKKRNLRIENFSTLRAKNETFIYLKLHNHYVGLMKMVKVSDVTGSKVRVDIKGEVSEIIDRTVKSNSANKTGYLYFPEKYVGKNVKILVMENGGKK